MVARRRDSCRVQRSQCGCPAAIRVTVAFASRRTTLRLRRLPGCPRGVQAEVRDLVGSGHDRDQQDCGADEEASAPIQANRHVALSRHPPGGEPLKRQPTWHSSSINPFVRGGRVNDARQRSGADVHRRFRPLNPPTQTHPSSGTPRQQYERHQGDHDAAGKNDPVQQQLRGRRYRRAFRRSQRQRRSPPMSRPNMGPRLYPPSPATP